MEELTDAKAYCIEIRYYYRGSPVPRHFDLAGTENIKPNLHVVRK